MADFSSLRRRRRQLAIALRYQEEQDPAPRVIARGSGYLARRIVDLAQAKGIPVRDDPDLVELLAQLDLGDLIPAEIYPAVAEILAYIYRLNGKYKNRANQP